MNSDQSRFCLCFFNIYSTHQLCNLIPFFQGHCRQPIIFLSGFSSFIAFLQLVWPTVQPEGQEQSPVMWWHVPPFWQGHRCSHWDPWLPKGQRSPQLPAHEPKVKCLGAHPHYFKENVKGANMLLVLTRLLCTLADRYTPQFHGCK